MIARLVYAYVGFLFVLDVLLFAASLSLHLSVFIMGANQAFAEYGTPLFRATVIVWILAFAFAKDWMWMNQIKTCPKWMWKGALTVGVYSLLIACVESIFSQSTSLSEQPMTVSGFPLGFDAISLCILRSILWSGYLEKSEVLRRALHSAVFVALGIIVFVAYRAGYLHHPKNN